MDSTIAAVITPGLTDTEWTVIKMTATGSILFQLTWFLCLNRFYVQTERQRAYVLSLLSSFVTSLGSLPFVYRVVCQQRGDLNQLLFVQSNATLAMLSVAVTIFFMTFLCLDLIVGWFMYRKKIDMLTGWVHHITYFCLLCWVLQQHFSGIFVAMCLLEIPTFLLALGSLHRPWRRDYLFASAFLSTRIVFHSFMIVSAFALFRFGAITRALFAFLPVHVYWFIGFIKQQKRLYRQRKLDTAAAKLKTTTTTTISDPTTDDVHTLSISNATTASIAATTHLNDDDDDPTATDFNASTTATITPTTATIRKRLRSSSTASYMMISSTTDRLRRTVVPTDFNFLSYPSPQMIQRLADHLPESISRDLVRSSEKLRRYWDLVYQRFMEEQQQDPPHTTSSSPPPAVAAH